MNERTSEISVDMKNLLEKDFAIHANNQNYRLCIQWLMKQDVTRWLSDNSLNDPDYKTNIRAPYENHTVLIYHAAGHYITYSNIENCRTTPIFEFEELSEQRRISFDDIVDLL